MQVSWSNTNLCLSDLLSKCRIACMVRWRRNFKFWAKFTLQVTALVTKRKETRMRFDMVYITLTDTIKRKRETEGKEKARKKWERNTEETLLLLPGGRGGKGAWACAQRVMIDEWRECSCRQRVPSAEWWVLSVVFQSANDGWKMTGEKWRVKNDGGQVEVMLKEKKRNFSWEFTGEELVSEEFKHPRGKVNLLYSVCADEVEVVVRWWSRICQWVVMMYLRLWFVDGVLIVVVVVI